MDWDDYFMGIVDAITARSKDRSTKVGCVIVGPNNDIRSTGFNGFPRGTNDDADERHQRPEKYMWTEHAERNAIYNAARHGTALDGCRIYIPFPPCMDCARAIVQSGLVEVIGRTLPEDDPLWERWGDSIEKSEQLFEETGVKIRIVA